MCGHAKGVRERLGSVRPGLHVLDRCPQALLSGGPTSLKKARVSVSISRCSSLRTHGRGSMHSHCPYGAFSVCRLCGACH